MRISDPLVQVYGAGKDEQVFGESKGELGEIWVRESRAHLWC